MAHLKEQVDIFSLQKLMGHSDIQILRRYLQQTEEDIRSAHELGGPVNNLLGFNSYFYHVYNE